MKLIKTVLLLLVVLNTSTALMAQKGKDLLITNNGDTLRGKIKAIEKYAKSLSFRDSEQNEYKTYSATDISFAHYKTNTYQSVIIKSISDERVFLQVLALGKINLYKGEDRYFLEKDSVVQTLTKKDTVINNVHKTDKSYIGYLTVWMRDGDIPIDKINTTGFNDNDLSSLVTRYNQHKGEQVPSTNFQQKKESSFSLGVKGGLYTSTLKYTTGRYSGFTFDPHQGSLFGLYATIRITNKFYVQPELYFVSKGGAYSHKLDDYEQRAINFDYLMESSQIAVNFRYNVVTGRVTPYLLGGFCYAITTKSKTYRQLVYEGYTSALPDIDLVSEIGYRGALGINYKVFKGWQISVEGLLENTRIHVSSQNE